jgi:trigger factor
MMAQQAGDNPRRLRARLIKSGMIENLEAQVRERLAIEVILEHAQFNDVPGQPLVKEPVASLDQSVCRSPSDTPADKPGDTPADEETADAGETTDETDQTNDAATDGDADDGADGVADDDSDASE